MGSALRILGIVFAFGVTTIAWLILGGVTSMRSGDQRGELRGEVADLWGSQQAQAAPTFTFAWETEREVTRTEQDSAGAAKVIHERVKETQQKEASPASTLAKANLHLDPRLKGLTWYALYDVAFEGRWTYVHREPVAGRLSVAFTFPDPQAVYDGFRFTVGGKDLTADLRPTNGVIATVVDVTPGQTVELEVAYKSRGMDQWSYVPGAGVASLDDFKLRIDTDFTDIDFPSRAMSPSAKTRTERGYSLDWQFEQALTGRAAGVVMPAHVQPGELAASLSFSAPISLFFFFLVVFVLATLRGIDIHPINYLFLGGAFLAFHLLFAYSVDHLEVVPAFALSSVVSVALVTSYLRLVVSARFAFVEAALAQLVYLVGFSLAHFWEGFTGLTVTVISIATLFLLMQLTGRIRWSEALSRKPPSTAPALV